MLAARKVLTRVFNLSRLWRKASCAHVLRSKFYPPKVWLGAYRGCTVEIYHSCDLWWNHRMASIGKYLKGHLVAIPPSWTGTPSTRPAYSDPLPAWPLPNRLFVTFCSTLWSHLPVHMNCLHPRSGTSFDLLAPAADVEVFSFCWWNLS